MSDEFSTSDPLRPTVSGSDVDPGEPQRSDGPPWPLGPESALLPAPPLFVLEFEPAEDPLPPGAYLMEAASASLSVEM